MGFLAADGCITRGNCLRVNVALGDRDHLGRLRSFLRATHPIATVSGYAALSIYSPELVTLLGSYGITPRKSLTLRPPVGLSKEDSLAYLSGYFDGDGYLTVSPGGYLTWQVLGTEALLSWARGVLGGLPNAPRRAKKGGQIYEIRRVGAGAEEICRMLENPWRLARKRPEHIWAKWGALGRKLRPTWSDIAG